MASENIPDSIDCQEKSSTFILAFLDVAFCLTYWHATHYMECYLQLGAKGPRNFAGDAKVI